MTSSFMIHSTCDVMVGKCLEELLRGILHNTQYPPDFCGYAMNVVKLVELMFRSQLCRLSLPCLTLFQRNEGRHVTNLVTLKWRFQPSYRRVALQKHNSFCPKNWLGRIPPAFVSFLFILIIRGKGIGNAMCYGILQAQIENESLNNSSLFIHYQLFIHWLL